MVGQPDYFRRGRVSRLTPQQRVDAKINFMREKYKRQLACKCHPHATLISLKYLLLCILSKKN